MTNKINDAMAELGAFAQRHPEITPDKLEHSTKCLVRFLKSKKLALTAENLEWGWKMIVSMVEAMQPESEPESDEIPDTPEQIEATEALVRQINSWSSDEMKARMKADPEVAGAVENVLAEKARLEKLKAKKVQTKPAAPKPVAPKRSAEATAIERMSADELKRALAKSPEMARGIENTLRTEARRAQ